MTNGNFLSDKERFREGLETLNETQRKSVLSDATTLQILAGPGSGKTRVLTFRVAYLVIEKHIYPNQIVVVTFTNKAANEMKSRLIGLIGEARTNMLLIGTFHAICSKLIRKHPAYAGVDPKFTICDTDQSKDIISELQKDKDLPIDDFTRTQMKAGAIQSIISKAKSKGENEYMYQNLYGEKFECRNIAIIFMAYEKELKRQNLVDFDNLLLRCCDLLRNKSDVLSRVKCILVDEYQDTNIVQYDLIKLMRAQVNNKTVTIVGDPDQSIFGWRSAEPKNFGKMAEEFHGTSSINMEQNYRSTGKVIQAAVHVITQDQNRIDKNLYTNNPIGIPISLISTQDPQSQAEFVAAEIKKAIIYSKGLIEYRDIAILMRMNAFSRQLEGVFRLNKIPFTMVGGERFFDRIEVKDMVSYLLFAYNPKNTTAFSRIVNVPRRGIGDVWMKRILECNRDAPGDSMLDTLKKIVKRQSPIQFTFGIITKLKDFINIVGNIRSMIEAKNSVANILSYIYEATKYLDYLKEHYFAEHEARWQNLSELLTIAKENGQPGNRENPHYDENGEFEDPTVVYAVEDNSDSEEEEDELDSSSEDMGMADFQDEILNAFRNRANVKDEVRSEPGVKIVQGVKREPGVKKELGVKKEPKVKSEPTVESVPNVKPEPNVKSEPGIKREDADLGLDDFGSEEEEEEEEEEEYETASDHGAANSSEQRGGADEFDDDDSDPVNDFLEYCVLSSNQKELDEADQGGGKVTIATMHSSKGLEWPMVFVVTCNEGVIPHSLCEHIEEEGRLLYVAMTRSKFFLYCISPRERDQWGHRKRESRSHFLNGMGGDLHINKPPDWDSDIRTMLAETINRPVPDQDDLLTTRKTAEKPKKAKKEVKREVKEEYFSSQPQFTDIRFGVNGSRADLSSMGGFSSAASQYQPYSSTSNKKKSNRGSSSSSSSSQLLATLHVGQTASSQPPPVRTESSSNQPPIVATSSSDDAPVKKKFRSVAPPKIKIKREHKDKKVKAEPTVKEEPDSKRAKLEKLL